MLHVSFNTFVLLLLKDINFSHKSLSQGEQKQMTAAVAQWVRALAPQAKGWVLESKRQTLVVKTGSDSSTAKRSAIGVSVTGPRR